MIKITETTVKTQKGAEMRVFIDAGTIKVETPIGVMQVTLVSRDGIDYQNGEKKMSSNIKEGLVMARAMFNSVQKADRDLFISEDNYFNLNLEGVAEFGTPFEIVEESGKRWGAAYKYLV